MFRRDIVYLSLLSAFLLWLAWPPMQFTTPLLFIGLVPLFIALDRIRKSNVKKKGKKIFLTAGLTFVVWNAGCIYWIYNAVSAYNEGIMGSVISAAVCLIPFGLGASLLTFAVWLHYRLGIYVNKGIAWVAFVVFFISMEYLQQSWDLAFPWMTLGNGLAGMHQLAQWYDHTGVYGGSLWILLSNILAFEAWKKFRSEKGYLKFRYTVAWLVVIILPAAISLVKYYNYEEAINPSNVVVVQPNIDPYLKFGSFSPREQVALMTGLSDSAGQKNTEFFIWPETAIPNYGDEDKIRINAEYLQTQSFLSKYKNGTLITGIESIKWYDTEKTLSSVFIPDYNMYIDHFNAAMQVENSPKVSFYHKSKLVPGVEKLPFPKITSFLKPVFAGLGGTVGGWGWQDEPAVFYSQGGIGVTPAICYESLWGDWIGKSVKEGAQFIAIITNDGWWGNTPGKDQHLLYAKLRAIETRRYVARSANTGISAFINQRGDIVKEAGWWKRTALKADINLNSELTLYVKSGDMIAKVCCVLAILMASIIPYKRFIMRRNKSGAATHQG